MSSTHLSLHYHIVFSTKNREPWIASEWRPRLHAYLGGTVRTLEGIPEEIGGIEDHVHLLIGLRATHCLADVVRNVKRESSSWIHNTIGVPGFAWQEGYGAFTISPTQRDSVRRYIQGQEEHHRRERFQDEYVGLLQTARIEYEDRYLW